MYIYIYVHMYICKYIYTPTHTEYIHTHTQRHCRSQEMTEIDQLLVDEKRCFEESSDVTQTRGWVGGLGTDSVGLMCGKGL